MQTAAEQCDGSESAKAGAVQECARLPASCAFHAVDATRHIPRHICLADSEAPAAGGGCELVMIKEVLIHLTLNDAVRVVEQVLGLAQAAKIDKPVGGLDIRGEAPSGDDFDQDVPLSGLDPSTVPAPIEVAPPSGDVFLTCTAVSRAMGPGCLPSRSG